MGKKGAGGGKGAGQRSRAAAEDAAAVPIPESTRIRLAKVLEDFRSSPDEVYTFDSNLSKFDRAAIHRMCRKMGLISKSTGKNANRRISIYKSKDATKHKNNNVTKGKGVETNKRKQKQNQSLEFTEDTKSILQDLFTHYPPYDGEVTRRPKDWMKKNLKGSNKDNGFCRPVMSKKEISKKVEDLARKTKEDPQLKKVAEGRARLPITSFRDEITSAFTSNQVVLISGETGCGKTTQVPQYILDHTWSRGETCKIICTQPRRLSAISVAERISYERGETVGNTVGYKIRLESIGGKHSSVMFCTNGILLRMLIGRGSAKSTRDYLMEITHIIVDEIHERDRFSDFILAILRDLLPSYPHLRLLLMSATMDAQRFSQYFNGCPVITVPGFTYPVKSFYLEDVLSILHSAEANNLGSSSEETDGSIVLDEDYKASLDESIDLAMSNDEVDSLLELVLSTPSPQICNYQHSSTGISPLMVLAGKGKIGEVCMLLSCGASCNLIDNDGNTVLDWAKKENQTQILEIIEEHIKQGQTKHSASQELMGRYLATVDPENIDTVLIEKLLRKICLGSDEGAILIFLPGWEDINKTKERLLATSLFRDSSKFLILPLHSMIPSTEQKKVFKRPPTGVRKIIISTNIAETAVTIDDVVFVIDSGLMKEKSYDPYNNVSTLLSSWISKANARQREGRAGRCQPGVCYHLYSKTRAVSFLDYQVPEIKRMPIEDLCLQVKMLDPGCRIVDFLQKTLDPPVHQSIINAVNVLQSIGALTSDENLTDLGEKLGSLPVHPSISKMLLFAILMNCLDPALTLACASDYRDPFLLPMAPGERKRAADAKIELASLYGGYGDHLTVIAAFDCWRSAKEAGQEKQFCSRYFVSAGTMNMLFGMRQQLQNELVKVGFISNDTSNSSLNARNPGVLRAVLTAGAYPLVGKLLPPQDKHRRPYVETSTGAKVGLNSRAINFKASSKKSTQNLLVVYDEITRGEGRSYIKFCSAIGPFPLLLLATEMYVSPSSAVDEESDEDDASDIDEDEMCSTSTKNGQGIMSSPENNVSIVVDGWLMFDSTALDAAQIYCLRERLSEAILFKVQYPRQTLPPPLGASMHAIAAVLSSEGLSGICPPLNPVGPVSVVPAGRKAQRQSLGRGKFPISLMSRDGDHMPHQGKSDMQVQEGSKVAKYEPQNLKAPSHGASSMAAAPNGKSFKRQHAGGANQGATAWKGQSKRRRRSGNNKG